MKNNYPRVSMVTVNFNGKKYLKKLLDSVFLLDYPKNKLEVILVDNVSTDNSVEFVKRNYRKVKIIKNDVNNYCKALNLGIESAKSDYIALINNDMRLNRDWLAELVKVITREKNIGCVGSKILDNAGKIRNAGNYELPNFYWGERGAGKHRSEYDKIEEVSGLCGAAVLYRKDALLKAGLFDEDFVMFVEDMDMSLRLRQRGYRLVFVPTSTAYHKFHGTATEELCRYYVERNRLLFVAKHYPHKLSSSLLGNGYFTARKSVDSCARIYSIFPEIIMKLVSVHPPSITNKIVSELFEEIGRLVNHDNDILAKEIYKITEDRNKTYEMRGQLLNELQHKNEELFDKDARLAEKDAQANRLREEIQMHLYGLQSKEGEVAGYKEEIASYKSELANLSGHLRSRMDQLLVKDGQLVENKIEMDTLKEKLSVLNGQIANNLVTIQEQEKEISAYKDELSSLSKDLRSRMDQLLVKDGQLIKNKTEIHALRKELSSLAEQTADNLVNIEELKNELNGIYSSEGFRFILRPLWTLLWDARALARTIGLGLKQAFWFAVSVALTPLFLFLSLFFAFEHMAWVMFAPLLRKTTPQRRLASIKDAKISLVIPNYNGIACLRECLPSVFSADGFTDGKNEVLVVDDASTDGSADFIRNNFPAVRLVQNKKNRGFGFTCNRGIKAARSEVVVLINNDIILTKEFLAPLLAHLEDESVFVVTPKLYAWDKKTFVWGMHMGHFEQGYIRLWNEAETGNGERVERPSPSIFAIGGAMVFRKKDFLWLGGFDRIYRPNCWEDIDISYRAWKRGMKVIYEPKSIMYHKGRATLTYERHKEIKNELSFTWKNITDSAILKNHLNLLPWNLYRNRKAFLRGFLWALNLLPETLLHRFAERRFIVEPKDGRIFKRTMLYYDNFSKRGFRHLGSDKPNVLIVSRFMPYPLNAGGKIRIHNLVRLMSRKYNFILLSLIDHENELKNLPELKKIFSEVYPIHAKSDLKIDFISKLFYPRKYKLGLSYSQELIDRLREIQDNTPVDLVHIESNELLYLTDYIKYAPVVYTEHDISILNPGRSYYKQKGNALSLTADYLKRLNFHISRVKQVDKVVILSKEDMKVFREFFPASDMTLVPTGVDLGHFSFRQDRRGSKKLIFVGHYRHYPNEDAIVYFTNKIFPYIRKRVPETELLIVGSDPTPRVRELEDKDNVSLVGEVEDVKTYLDMAAVFVNSVRVSAGIKGKVLEAMACGMPVVSTTTGSYGIDAVRDKEIIIADNPRKFAKQVARLLCEDGSGEKIAKEARKLVEDKYDWFKIIEKLDKVYRSVIFEPEFWEGSKHTAIDRIIDRTKRLVEDRIQSLNGLMSYKGGPEELHIELTYKCDSKCIMCDLWDYHKRFPVNGKRELSFDEIRGFVEGSRYLQNTKVAVLSGGEPFLRKDLPDICGFFTRHHPGISIGILTNGMNTEDILSKTGMIFDRFQPKSLWLGSSLDGLGVGHDRIRGIEGAFRSFDTTVERCKKEFPQLRISATFTLTPYNIDQLIPAREYADSRGLDFYAQLVVPKEFREQFNWTPQNLNLAEKEITKVIEDIIGNRDLNAVLRSVEKQKDKSLISNIYYWSHLLKYQTNPQRFFKKCVAGAKFAMFNPYGELFFCPNHKKSVIGDIRQEKFDDIWVSKKAEHMRCFIEDNSCHCWLVCVVFPVLEKALSNN